MIFDHLSNSGLYAPIQPGLKNAFQFLQSTDLIALPAGRVEIDGADLYALVQDYPGKPPEQGKWEAHRRYIDVQYVASGHERVGIASINRMDFVSYDEVKDQAVYRGQSDLVALPQGYFMVFFPQDVHMPALAAEVPTAVRKIVVKVRLP